MHGEEDEADSAGAVRLREVLLRLVRGIGLLDRQDAECCGITLGQCHALGEIVSSGGLTSRELAARLRVDPSAVTRIADGLTGAGLVRREGDPADRRVIRLFPTAEGHSVWGRVCAMMTERARAVLGHVPPADREVVLAALERLASALEIEGYIPGRERERGGSRDER